MSPCRSLCLLLFYFQRVASGPCQAQTSTLASSGSGFDGLVGTLYEVYELANFSDSGRASASVKRAAKMRDPCRGRGRRYLYLVRICVRRLRTSTHKNVHGCAVHAMTRRPFHPERMHHVPVFFHARRPPMSVEVGGRLAVVNASFLLCFLERSGTGTLTPLRAWPFHVFRHQQHFTQPRPRSFASV